MPRPHPWQLRSPPSRVAKFALAIAVAIHVGVLVWLNTRELGSARPPSMQGANAGAAGGLPVKNARNVHTFRVVDGDSEDAPVPRAWVRDVLGEEENVTRDDGLTVLTPHSAAKLIVQVEKPGFALHAEQFANTESSVARHTIHLKRAAVPWFIVDTIFLQRCNYCHGSNDKLGGVDLSTYARAMASRSGNAPVVIPGQPDSSRLVSVLASPPPRDSTKRRHSPITDMETDWLTVWIRQGARQVVAR